MDNVVRNSRVSKEKEYKDETNQGIRDMLKAIKGDNEVEATTIGTVGEKGYDGFLYAIRK